jgi:hypothetical protein
MEEDFVVGNVWRPVAGYEQMHEAVQATPATLSGDFEAQKRAEAVAEESERYVPVTLKAEEDLVHEGLQARDERLANPSSSPGQLHRAYLDRRWQRARPCMEEM